MSSVPEARAYSFACDSYAGAGWGGATVSLVREPDVPNFIDVLRREYYGKRFPDLSEQELHDACFATKPEAGANVFAGEL